jgi:hypothetical protein
MESINPPYQMCLPRILSSLAADSNFVASEVPKPSPYRLYNRGIPVDIDFDKLGRDMSGIMSGDGRYVSGYFTSTSTRKDSWRRTLGQMGFDAVWDYEQMREYLGEYVDHDLDGYGDSVMMPFVAEFMGVAAKAGKSAFITVHATRSQYPWSQPPDDVWMRITGTDATLNSYLNAVKYEDRFVQELVSTFRQKGWSNDTLFIITSDHGSGLGEHGRKGVEDNIYQNALMIPYFIHHDQSSHSLLSPNAAFQMDLLPTLLDLLSADLFSDYGPKYHGQSLLRQRRSQISFSLITPGNRLLVAKQDYVKVVFDAKSLVDHQCEPHVLFVYDLKTDPDENFNMFGKSLDAHLDLKLFVEEVGRQSCLFAKWLRQAYRWNY